MAGYLRSSVRAFSRLSAAIDRAGSSPTAAAQWRVTQTTFSSGEMEQTARGESDASRASYTGASLGRRQTSRYQQHRKPPVRRHLHSRRALAVSPYHLVAFNRTTGRRSSLSAVDDFLDPFNLSDVKLNSLVHQMIEYFKIPLEAYRLHLQFRDIPLRLPR